MLQLSAADVYRFADNKQDADVLLESIQSLRETGVRLLRPEHLPEYRQLVPVLQAQLPSLPITCICCVADELGHNLQAKLLLCCAQLVSRALCSLQCSRLMVQTAM